MAEQLLNAGGKVIPIGEPVDPEFAAAMAAPRNGQRQAPDVPAPPRRDPEAPHGRDSDG